MKIGAVRDARAGLADYAPVRALAERSHASESRPMTQSSPSPIHLYTNPTAACLDYDPQFPFVAQHVSRLITEQVPDVRVEHVGSTSVPCCRGKGIIDLVVLYAAGRIEAVRQGRAYLLHVHVVAAEAEEAGELLAFRDRLRADAALREAYVARKLQILAGGVTDSLDYCLAKGSFVEDCLRAMR
jgi:GrpB-like predicted nucleotidyltransferase (UPF0157 family)